MQHSRWTRSRVAYATTTAMAALGSVMVLVAPVRAADGDGAQVVVTIKPVHALVSEVMEGVGSPLLIVDGSASPHTFTLKPSTARAISNARVFIRVSEQLEPFTGRLVAGLPSSVSVLSLADKKLGVTLLEQRRTGTFEAHQHDESGGDAHNDEAHDDHDGHDGHAGESADAKAHGEASEASHAEAGHADHDAAGADEHEDHFYDPHIWLDPENAKAIVTAVAGVLSEKWPDKKAIFEANAEKARARLDVLNADIGTLVKSVQDKPFVVFHDAYQYFERRFGLAAVGSITVSPNQQPSAKRLSEVRAKIKELKAQCVFAEPSFQPKLLAAVTEGTSARTGSLDPVGQSLTPGPQLYDVLMRGLARDLVACLSVGSSQ